MNYNNPIPQNIATIIRLSCTSLFVLFCFVYVFCMEGDLLAHAQYVFAHGVTTYYRGVGAIVITLVLFSIQYITCKLTHLKGRLYALNFFPSFLILAMLTSLTEETINDFTFGTWYWAFPLIIGLYILVIWLFKHFFDSLIIEGDYKIGRYLWPNFILLFFMMIFCGACHSAPDVFMYEVKTERLIVNEDLNDAYKVGEKSLVTSKRLNNLRAFALVQLNILPEHLFDYPQPYGSKGLLDITDTCSAQHRITSKNVFTYLGAYPNSMVKDTKQYLEIMLKQDSVSNRHAIIDYYLCSLLLDHDMNTFNKNLHKYYHCSTFSEIGKLPKSYKEALILDNKYYHNNSLFPDTLIAYNYNQYKLMCNEISDSTERSNQTRRNFGNTLWWYLDNIK